MHHSMAARLAPPEALLATLATLAALAALRLSGVAGCRAAADGLAERQGFGGMDINASDLPKWWLPMYSALEASPFDGHLCGVAVRLGGGYFLAHTKSVDRAAQLQKTTKLGGLFILRLFGLFDYYPQTTINLASTVEYDTAWAPALTDTFESDIGLYKMVVREEYPLARPLHVRYPLLTSVCLQRDKTAKPDNCRIITYGDDVHAADGAQANTTRRLKMIEVREDGCDGSTCFMVTRDRAKNNGILCGIYSNLGNPIVCGAGSLAKITYLFWALGFNDNTLNCSKRFRAVKVAHIADRVWDIHTGYMRS